ncbi:hypothetical protein ASE00_01455 [Sphingomonas sp. Root710]|nr:hypothetical protein ASE00_01455 [Sphingomonas sp. Root710]
MSALSSEQLAAKGVAGTLDIASATPGLTYTQVGGTAAPRIRGVGSTTAIAGNENSVATYVDGVYYASSNTTLLSLTNIDQVAVLKGPQGTLFGRNATGGLIQITTLDPKQEFSGKLTGGYGNKDTVTGSMYVTGGLADGVAADLAVYYRNQRDGFGRNLTTGADTGDSKEFAVRSKWKFELGPDTKLTISGDYVDAHMAGLDRRPVTGSTPQVSAPFNGVPFTGGKWDTYSNISPSYTNRQGGGSVNLTHSFDGFDFVSLTAYRDSTSRLIFDIDTFPAAVIQTNNLVRDTQFSQEFQLISKSSGPFVWTAGAYYIWYHGNYKDVNIRLPTALQRFESGQRTKSPAIYAQGTYKFDERTSLTIGGRYSWETRKLDASGTTTVIATGAVIPTIATGKISVNKPTWRVALDHRFNPDVLVYASYNRGFKSGGFNAASLLSPPNPFLPEKLDAYEVGLKSDLLDRHLRVNGSAFYYDYSNIQVSSFINGLIRVSNAAKARIYGFDLEVTAKPTDELTLTSGVSVLNSKFRDFPGAQLSTPNATGGGNTIGSFNAKGNDIPYTPRWTLDLGFNYRVPLSSGSVVLNGAWFHSDGWYSDPDNRLQQRPYDLLNGSISWNIGEDERLSVAVWGRNLTNEAYATTLQFQSYADITVTAPGRTFGASLNYKF